ncbi:MAG: VOC family protein [Panacagrimonas sp.]
MEPRLSFITLGVADLDRATAFYRDILKLPPIPMPADAGVAFFEMGRTWLSLFPRGELAADAGVPAGGSGFGGFTLAHNLRSAEAVDALFAELAAAGVHIVKPPHRTSWGGYSGYFSDPDGFLWELAWNPHFPHA